MELPCFVTLHLHLDRFTCNKEGTEFDELRLEQATLMTHIDLIWTTTTRTIIWTTS